MSGNLDRSKNGLDYVLRIISGKRQEQHGSPERCFYDIARMVSIYLEGRDVSKLTELDVCMIMCLVKIVRAKHNILKCDRDEVGSTDDLAALLEEFFHTDHVTDLLGYGALAMEFIPAVDRPEKTPSSDDS